MNYYEKYIKYKSKFQKTIKSRRQDEEYYEDPETRLDEIDKKNRKQYNKLL
jgi:hypothetical protein